MGGAAECCGDRTVMPHAHVPRTRCTSPLSASSHPLFLLLSSHRLGDPSEHPLYKRLLSIYESDDKIPYVRKIGVSVYNFWTDSINIR